MNEYVPLSALEHYEYCPRQCALIHVDGLWADNAHTVRGQRFHRRADSGVTSSIAQTRVVRSLEVWSDRLGLIGRCDVVEIDGDTIIPVEYKAGSRHGITADIQVCAQAMCLEEMLAIKIDRGAIYYGAKRRRHRVLFDDVLRQHTEEAVAAVRALRDHQLLPRPVDDERCRECQLLGSCMPQLSRRDSSTVLSYLHSVRASALATLSEPTHRDGSHDQTG